MNSAYQRMVADYDRKIAKEKDALLAMWRDDHLYTDEEIQTVSDKVNDLMKKRNDFVARLNQ